MTNQLSNQNPAVKFTTLRQIKDYKGSIKAGVLGREGIVYFRITKKELIHRIEASSEFFWDNFSIEYEPDYDCLYIDSSGSDSNRG